MSTYNVIDFGAAGDGKANDAAAIQRAIDACSAGGGGSVLLPAGRIFRSGTIVLKSNVELHVERGARLAGSGDWADYTTRLVVGALSGGELDAAHPAQSMLITADRAENIAISGAGVIDGAGQLFIAERGRYIHKMKTERPFTIFLIGCHKVSLRDFTLQDGALWTLRLSGCEDVTIHSIHIENDLRLPNNDGIDLDRCRDVRISDCHIVCGDDCICLKSCLETAEFGACENITVTGCTLESTSSALILGAECRSPIRNVIFDACVIRSSNRGLAIHLSEESDIENVLFSNMLVETRLFHNKWWGHGEPIYITAIPWDAERRIGRVRHVRFSNVLARSENGVFIMGWPSAVIEDILLENVRVELERWSSWPGGRQDIRPHPGGDTLLEQPTSGFFIQDARQVTLRNCQVVWHPQGERGAQPAEFRHALETHHVEDLAIENFRGESAHPETYPAIKKS
jgi:hypothetical protein